MRDSSTLTGIRVCVVEGHVQKDTINLSLSFHHTYSRQVYVGQVRVISALTDEVRYLSTDERVDTHTHTFTVKLTHQQDTRGRVNPPLFFFKSSCLNIKYCIVCCKVIGF